MLFRSTNDRTWAILPDGSFCYWDFNDQIGKHTLFTKIKQDKISIQFYHFQDAEEIRVINEALREYKKTMPNPKEYKNADTAVFKPEFPLINSTDQAMRYALLHHNGFMVHASAISYDGQGILFSAPWCTLFPALVVTSLILGAGMLGEGIRENLRLSNLDSSKGL